MLLTKEFSIFSRVVPDIRLAGYPAGYPAFFDIRYPAGYPVSIAGYPAGYPAGRITGYPAGYPVKLLNKLCEFRMSKLISEPFH